MRLQFGGRPFSGFLAGAQGAFTGEAVEIVAAKVKREIPSGEAFAQSGHFAQSPGRKLGDANMPSYQMHKKHLAAAFRKGPLHNFACLPFDGFIVGVQAAELRRVPQEDARHARAMWASIGSAQVLHFDFRAGHNIRRKSISCVRNIRRLCERHGRINNPRILRSGQQLAKLCRKLWAKLRHELSGNCENHCARSKSLLFAFNFSFNLNAFRELLDMQDPSFSHDTDLGGDRFRNAIDTIRKSPLPTHEQVPDHLHEDHARRGFDRSADGTIQAGPEDALEYFFPADAAKIRPRVFAVERTSESAAAMDESAMMAQQVESEPQAGDAGAKRYSAVEEQVLEPPAAIAAATCGILNPHTETSFAHQRRQSQAAHERSHAHKSISKQRHATVDHKSIDPVGGHPATDARLRLQHQRVEAAVL